jgi:hypothetical protein
VRLSQADVSHQVQLKTVFDEKKTSDSKFEVRVDELTNAINDCQKENAMLKIKLNDVVCVSEISKIRGQILCSEPFAPRERC